MKGNFYKESVLTADSLDNKLADALQKGLRGYLGQDEDEDITLTIDGQEAYVFYGPVHHTGWSTVIVSPAIGIRIVGYIVGGMVVLVMFVTMFIGVLDLKSGHLRYCNAGHDAPMLIGRGVGTLTCIPYLPVGVIPDMKFVLQEDEIDRSTTIFLYTDGLNEAEDNTHAQFGMERIKALAESLLLQKQHQPERLINAMTDAVHKFVGDNEQSDDLTMLAIQLSSRS